MIMGQHCQRRSCQRGPRNFGVGSPRREFTTGHGQAARHRAQTRMFWQSATLAGENRFEWVFERDRGISLATGLIRGGSLVDAEKGVGHRIDYSVFPEF